MALSKRKEMKRRAQELARRLEHHPEPLERFESILDLSQSDELKRLDEIEEVGRSDNGVIFGFGWQMWLK